LRRLGEIALGGTFTATLKNDVDIAKSSRISISSSTGSPA